MNNYSREEQTDAVEPPPVPFLSFWIRFEVRDKLLQEQGGCIEEDSTDRSEYHLRGERTEIDTNKAICQLPARTRRRSPFQIRNFTVRIVCRIAAKMAVARMSPGTIGRSPISRLSAVLPSITTFVVYEKRSIPHTEAPGTRNH